MKLKEYLTSTGQSMSGFGKEIGHSTQRVHEWATGRKVPRAAALADIERATRGQVTAVDFVEGKK